ncbi:MFS transporter [Paenibacillus chartarius]|uniref:MFS transporter n=1 Tax=Paenibacillus chartarius TaxID=747481 RepID=A0ABV6DT47_9BACL
MTSAWKTNFRLLWVGHFLSVLSSMVIAPMLPFYVEQLGEDDPSSVLMWSGLCLVAPAVSAAMTAPLWGRLGDLSSRKWMVVRALLATVCVLAAMAWAATPLQLLVLRFLQGALGGVVDAVGAFAASEARPEEQGRVRGQLEGALAAGSMLGPLLGGLFLGTVGFRSLFLLLGGVLLLWTLLCCLKLKESRRERPAAAKPAGGKGARLWTSLLGDKRVILYLSAGIVANFAIYGLLPVQPLHVKQYVGDPSQTALWVGMLQAVNWASVWLSSGWWGRRNDASPVNRNFMIAAALCGAAVYMQAFAPGGVWLFPFRALQGFASSALLQSVFVIVTRASPGGQLGMRLGWTRSILFTGQIAGPMASGWLGAELGSSAILALYGTMIAAGGLLVGLFAGAQASASSNGAHAGSGVSNIERT